MKYMIQSIYKISANKIHCVNNEIVSAGAFESTITNQKSNRVEISETNSASIMQLSETNERANTPS